MRDLLINGILKSMESGHLIRVLWISSNPKSICLFDMDTIAMPYWVGYAELQSQLNKGILTFQDSDPFLPIVYCGSGNWVIDNLNNALQTWNEKLAEIWQLVTQSPTEFKGGGIWHYDYVGLWPVF